MAVVVGVFAVWTALGSLHVSANGSEARVPALPTEYRQMLQELPDALLQSLPDEAFSTDPESAARAWQMLLSPRGLVTLITDMLAAHWRDYLRLLLTLLGVLLLRAVWNALATSVKPEGLSGGVQLLCRLVLFGVIVKQALGLLTGVVAFYADLNQLTAAFLPLMGAMYAMGGNVGAAVVNHSTLVMSMSAVEWVGGKSVVPLFSLCLAFALLGAFEGSVAGRMQILTGKLKKWYTTGLGLLMLLLSGTLAAQSVLTARADSLGFRTVRFAVSSSIPIVGGGVADMLRTAASGLGYLRGMVGVGGVVLILWLLLPQIISIWLIRILFGVAGDIAGWMGCGEEGKLLGEVSSLYGYLLAVVAISAVTFFFALVLLIKCGAAYAA